MRLAVVFGTRPEAIKLIPLVLQLRKNFDVYVVNSGQHRELLKQVLDFFDVRPDIDLSDKIKKDRSLSELASSLITHLDTVYKQIKPDMVIVQGDTMTAFTASFVAYLNKIPVSHVEAGLRSYSKYSPFPEEMMRRMIGCTADMHFAPTGVDVENLLKENIPQENIYMVGNTVVDALFLAKSFINERRVFSELGSSGITKTILKNRKVVFITSHRRENIGKPLKDICEAVKNLCKKYPDFVFIWSLHLNPQVRKIVMESFSTKPYNLFIIEPVSYETTVYLLDKAFIVLTDSGGLQEECASLGKPVLVLRNETERSLVILSGAGFLVGSSAEKITHFFEKLAKNPEFYKAVSEKGKGLFGDGTASLKIKDILLKNLREISKKGGGEVFLH